MSVFKTFLTFKKIRQYQQLLREPYSAAKQYNIHERGALVESPVLSLKVMNTLPPGTTKPEI